MSDNGSFFDQLRKTSLLESADIDSASDVTLQDALHDDALADGEQIDNAVSSSNMPAEARRALVSLLRQGVVLADQKMAVFTTICRYQEDIRRHFSDMYLQLVLDEKVGVAFVSSMDDDSELDGESEDSPVSLISKRTLSLYDTLLLLVLRKHYQERETSGEQKIVIDIERVESNLTPFLPLTNSSKSDRKKLNAALQKMLDRRLLSAIRGSEDRYIITPIIRYVVNAEFLQSMLNEYQKLSEQAGVDLGFSAQARQDLEADSQQVHDDE